jgi:hypothetical protein
MQRGAAPACEFVWTDPLRGSPQVIPSSPQTNSNAPLWGIFFGQRFASKLAKAMDRKKWERVARFFFCSMPPAAGKRDHEIILPNT